jgi:transglutaminase-like putative cysteine protease
LVNIIAVHYRPLREAYYWLYKKLIKPKYKLGDIVLLDGEMCEVIHISPKAKPYEYLCLPLNKNNTNIYYNYYPQKRLKPISDLLKSLL